MPQRITALILCRRSLQKSSTTRKNEPEWNHLNSYKNQLTTIFPEINDDPYLLQHLTSDPETQVFKTLTERVDGGKKSFLSALKGPSNTFL